MEAEKHSILRFGLLIRLQSSGQNIGLPKPVAFISHHASRILFSPPIPASIPVVFLVVRECGEADWRDRVLGVGRDFFKVIRFLWTKNEVGNEHW